MLGKSNISVGVVSPLFEKQETAINDMDISKLQGIVGVWAFTCKFGGWVHASVCMYAPECVQFRCPDVTRLTL